MADEAKTDTPEQVAEATVATEQAPQAPQAPAQSPQRAALQIDDSSVAANYANFCRVTGTPEELIIDFGLNPQPMGIPTEPIPVTQRIITNFYTAKRMVNALAMTVQRHEATFGVLEIDVQRRVRADLRQAAPPQQ